jgi:hypothetical protein
VDIIIALLLAIVGLAVGFVSGIVDLVVGLVKLVMGIFQLLVDAFVAMLGRPEDLKEDWNSLVTAVQRIPQGIKQAVDDWVERYKHATLEEQVLMGGEIVGQIEAFIATFALAGTKAGQAGNIAVRAEVNVPKIVRFAGGPLDVALTTVPKTVTATIPAAVPATAAQVSVVASQATMMAAHGPQGGGGSSGGGSGSKASSDPADRAPAKQSAQKAPKSGEQEPEPPKSEKPKSAADAESNRLQQKYGSRSKTKYPSLEWKRIEQLEQRYPKLKSARLRPFKRPGVADESIFEERMQTTQGNYSLAAYSEDGEMIIQFDGISPEGFVEEVKIGQTEEKVGDIVTQLRRQADFARDYGLKGVEYSVSPPMVADLVEQEVAAEKLNGVYRAKGF